MGTKHAVASEEISVSARRAGFSALYDRHVAEVYRFVHRRCLDRATAEDVTHDTFVTAVRMIDDPEDVTVGWLMAVARNRLLDIVRRQTRQLGKLRLIGAVCDDVDRSAAVDDRILIHAALERLTVEHRLVLALHYLDGLTTTAIAEELGRSPKSVEGLVTRARRNLRRELEKPDA